MNDDELFSRITGNLTNPKARAAAEAEQKKAAVERNAAVDRIAEQMIGIKPEHSDPIYTQHPIMAGVIREALRRAYDEGQSSLAKRMLQEFVASRRAPNL